MTLEPPDGEPAPARVSSGIAGLDTILGGGFMLGGMYIIQGDPGAGKTILTNQISFHHVAGGGRALFVTLLAENHARMIGNMRGLSFFDEAVIPDRLTYLSAFNEMHDGGLDTLLDLLRREIIRTRTSLLVIDGLISAEASSESDQAFREMIHDLQEIALASDCTMFLTTSNNDMVSPERTMVDGLIELNERVYGWQVQSDLQVRKFRGSGFLRGRHSYKISDAGITVHPRIEALLARPSQAVDTGLARTSTGIDQLDAMLGGGLPSASTTMVMGPSGVGKTTLGLHFLSRSSAEEPGMMFGFYETPVRLRAKVDQLSPALGKLFDDNIIELLWQTPTSDLLDVYGERLLEAVYRRGVKRLFIDGLTAFKNSSIDTSRIGNFFSTIANQLRVIGVTTVYSVELREVFGSGFRMPIEDASSLAENLILLRYVEQGARLHRFISILKARDSDIVPLRHEYALTAAGMIISDSADSAELILSARRDDGPHGHPPKHGG